MKTFYKDSVQQENGCFVGIDLGTSGVRGTALSFYEEILAEVAYPLPPPEEHIDGIRQDPSLWWDAVLAALTELARLTTGHPWLAIAVDGTSGTVLTTNEEGQALGLARMYSDTRCTEWQEQIAQLGPPDSPARGTGSALARALALLVEHPHAARICTQADWIMGKLCGVWSLSDENNCLKLGYDPMNRRWPDWLDNWPQLASRLPRVLPAGTHVGAMSEALRQSLGLQTIPQILTGTTDSLAAFLACGADKPGQAMTALGTSLVIKLMSPNPVNASAYGIYSHHLNNHWLTGGASNCGAGVLLQYFSQNELVSISEQIDPSLESGLDYYPLLQPGERFPINDSRLQPRINPIPADKVQFLHGLFESIARIEKQGYDLLNHLGADYPEVIYTTGGGSRNKTWTKIRQRVLGVPVQTARHTEASYGIARLARISTIEKNSKSH